MAYAEVRRHVVTDGRQGIPSVRIGAAIRVARSGLVKRMQLPDVGLSL